VSGWVGEVDRNTTHHRALQLRRHSAPTLTWDDTAEDPTMKINIDGQTPTRVCGAGPT